MTLLLLLATTATCYGQSNADIPADQSSSGSSYVDDDRPGIEQSNEETAPIEQGSEETGSIKRRNEETGRIGEHDAQDQHEGPRYSELGALHLL